MTDVIRNYNSIHPTTPLKLILTYLYPNKSIVERYNTSVDEVTYIEKAVDAAVLQDAPKGLKTMVNSFHHMPPQ